MTMATNCTKTITLNTGAKIPAIGLGTWKAPEQDCYNAVLAALHEGYRHIDTARLYLNEEAVGRAINDFLAEGTTKRSELFITTKLWASDARDPETALRASLQRLGLDYVDLYLMHWPVVVRAGAEAFPKTADGANDITDYEEFNYVDSYKLMQPLIKLGLTKAIGVSNYNKAKLENLLSDKDVTVVPACNQIELHPYLPQTDLIDFCKSKKIVVEAYSPFGSSGAPLLKEPALSTLATKYYVSPACIVISWAVARDTVVLPKSVNPARVASNLKTVELSPSDIATIDKLYKSHTERFVTLDWGIDVFDSDGKFLSMSASE